MGLHTLFGSILTFKYIRWSERFPIPSFGAIEIVDGEYIFGFRLCGHTLSVAKTRRHTL